MLNNKYNSKEYIWINNQTHSCKTQISVCSLLGSELIDSNYSHWVNWNIYYIKWYNNIVVKALKDHSEQTLNGLKKEYYIAKYLKKNWFLTPQYYWLQYFYSNWSRVLWLVMGEIKEGIFIKESKKHLI